VDAVPDWAAEVPEQLDWHWRTSLRPRLDGLTDDEYLWEPVPEAWSVREFDGRGAIDWAWPAPSPPPVTTIAWRLAHVTVGCFEMRSAAHFGGPASSWDTADLPLHADDALARLDAAHARWSEAVTALGPEGMARPCGPAEPYPEAPLGVLVLHINREVIHHGAEIALLRDLYAHR
jgi:hypothetical protein